MVSSILQKNERKKIALVIWYLRSNCICLFFGRIEDTINCFRDLLTFNIIFNKNVERSLMRKLDCDFIKILTPKSIQCLKISVYSWYHHLTAVIVSSVGGGGDCPFTSPSKVFVTDLCTPCSIWPKIIRSYVTNILYLFLKLFSTNFLKKYFDLIRSESML